MLGDQVLTGCEIGLAVAIWTASWGRRDMKMCPGMRLVAEAVEQIRLALALLLDRPSTSPWRRCVVPRQFCRLWQRKKIPYQTANDVDDAVNYMAILY